MKLTIRQTNTHRDVKSKTFTYDFSRYATDQKNGQDCIHELLGKWKRNELLDL